MKKLLLILIVCCSLNGFGQVEIYKTINIGKNIKSFSISKDKKYLATSVGRKKTELLIYDIKTGEIVKRLKVLSKQIARIQYSPNGKYLVLGSTNNNEITVLNTDNYELLYKFHPSGETINDLCFFHDDMLATSSKGGIIATWDLIKGKMISSFDTKYRYISKLTFDKINSRFLISGYNNKEKKSTLFFLDENLNFVNQQKLDCVCFVRYLPECNKVLTLDEEKYIVQEIDSEGKKIHTYNRHKFWVYYVIGINQCEYIVSTSHDKTLKIYKGEKCVYKMDLKGIGFKIEKISNTEFAFMDMKGLIKFIRINID